MDIELLTGALGATPQVAALSGMVLLVIMLLRQIGTHEDEKALIETRHAAQMSRLDAQYDSDVTQLREENDRLRAARDAAEARVREHLGLAEATTPVRPVGRRRLGS